MLRKTLSLLLCAVLVISLVGCAEAPSQPTAAPPTPGSDAATDTEVQAPVSSAGDHSTDEDAQSPEAAATSEPIERAPDENYYDYLERLWDNSDEEGYVWTITIDQVSTLDVVGLVTVDYDLALSCSHVGPTMYGAYKGVLDVAYSADMSGMVELLTVTGGSVDYDADGWMKNDSFLMELDEFDAEIDEQFNLSLAASDQTQEEREVSDAILDAYLGDVGSGDEDFEVSSTPEAMWYDWDMHMTEGDMSAYINMTNIIYGTTNASASSDASGTSASGSASTVIPGLFSSRDSTSMSFDKPFPYTIKVYGSNVVFELHSSTGGPATVKFYGTIDKIPVGDTIVP